MSETGELTLNDVADATRTKRESKLTGKALLLKIDNLQKDRKRHVNKLKDLIPAMKELMKRRDNAPQVETKLQTLNELYDSAVGFHDALIPLLPDDEKTTQNEWFSSIKGYTSAFKNDVTKWFSLDEVNANSDAMVVITDCVANGVSQGDQSDVHQAAEIFNPITVHTDPQDDVHPIDSISNVPSRQSAHSSKHSSISSTSSARIKAEADLAALMARQKHMQEKHALEEEEEQLRKRKERLKLDEDIAAQMAKISVLKSASLTSAGSTLKRSKSKNSQLSKIQARTLNVDAASFIPWTSEPSKGVVQATNNTGDPATRPKVRMAIQDTLVPFSTSEHSKLQFNPRPGPHGQLQNRTQSCAAESLSNNTGQSTVFDIMNKQNEITTLLMQQQQLSSLPKRDIQVFDGDPLQYHSFMRAFENGVESKSNSYSDRIYFLEQFTRGRPRELVRSCLHVDPERGYAQAKALLKEHYGNEHRISAAYMEKALSWSSIKSEDVKTLHDYSLFLRGCCNVMDDVQYMYELNMPANMLTIVKKLPYKLRDRWRTVACEIQERRRQRAVFSDLVHFIERQAKIVNDPVFGNIQDVSPELSRSMNRTDSKTTSRPKKSSFATTVNAVGSNTTTKGQILDNVTPIEACLFCEAVEHMFDVCPILKRRSHREKIAFLKEKGACFACLCIGHISKDCRKRLSCETCSLKHPTMLHIQSKERQNESETEALCAAVSKTVMSSDSTGAGGHDCKLPIVPVQIKSSKGNKTLITYAFLDQGSTAVFCTVNLMNKLDLLGKKRQILLHTMAQEKVMNSYMITGLEVAALDSDQFCQLPCTYTQQKMPVNRSNIPCQNDLDRWPHLRHVHLPEIDSEVELLIGTNVPKALEPLEVIRSVDDGPYAIKTFLGWTVNGPLGGNGNELAVATVNSISILNLDDLWQQQFKIDFPERIHDEQPGMSREDERFIKLVKDSVKLLNGHYQIALPLRHSQVRMPNNRKVAEQRAVNLYRRFKKDASFREQYTDFMNDVVLKGYAEQVPAEELARGDGRLWYIPHHGVYHPRKGTIRVVFDCGATFQSTCLNAQLLQGPDLTSSLVGVMTRFRKEPVVIMADIESMFHQVRVPAEDADLLRFLWWPNGDPTRELADFRMNVHLFGATSSPSCANFALRKCAEDNAHHFQQDTIDKVLHCFYVDDCLVATASEKEAVRLFHDLVSLCSKGGFKLTKWMSNRRAVLDAIPEEQRAKDMKDLDLNYDVLPVERVLGVQWCIQSDAFKFKIIVQERPATRRGILSIVSSIYDPLGILSPVVLVAKIILQQLCKKGLGWDDPIPSAAAQEWIRWLEDLSQLEQFHVTRCLKPSDFGEVIMAQLHHFTDASEEGYGVVTYLLLQNARLQLHSAFIMGKSRVAPLKPITIPRMELTAATMASRMDTFWKRELHMQLQPSVFWSDSTSVLKYIKNETSRFRTFVANRVSEILKVSQVSQWRYVNTTINPADLASRGSCADAFLKNKTWLSGPEYLLHPEQDWPVNPDHTSKLLPDDPEVRVSVTVNAVHSSEVSDATTRLICHFSSWIRLRKSVAWILRFKNLLLYQCQKKRLMGLNEQQGPLVCKPEVLKDNEFSGLLTVDELKNAEMAIIKFCQKGRFADEFDSLQDGRSVSKSSSLFKLCPVLMDGVLRVGGRLSRADMPEDTKHPIILSKDFHISDILLRHIHQEVGHSGRNYMLSRLRQNYWITGATTAIRRILSRCVICRRLQAAPGSQQMADLPVDRVRPDEAPFTRVGVDLFGPFEVKSRRSIVKRYGVMFTCLSIRAVHIEVASSLDIDSFINTLRRFIARRGQVLEIRSDNGTNFVGAERELRQAIEGWNHSRINNMLLQKNIKWVFNPPAGSHHGGAWERLIRSVRKVLNSTLRTQNLDEEGFHTVLCEIESILNGRPLTKASVDPDDLEVLTPNHLLLLKTSPSLPPGEFQKDDIYARRRWKQVQYMSNLFWKRWVQEYLPQLQERQKWASTKRNFVVGDIVLIVDETAPRNSWVMGKVVLTFPDKRGLVRRLQIKTKTNLLDRPITKVCLLQEAES